jgi:hypothetical protein
VPTQLNNSFQAVRDKTKFCKDTLQHKRNSLVQLISYTRPYFECDSKLVCNYTVHNSVSTSLGKRYIWVCPSKLLTHKQEIWVIWQQDFDEIEQQPYCKLEFGHKFVLGHSGASGCFHLTKLKGFYQFNSVITVFQPTSGFPPLQVAQLIFQGSRTPTRLEGFVEQCSACGLDHSANRITITVAHRVSAKTMLCFFLWCCKHFLWDQVFAWPVFAVYRSLGPTWGQQCQT